MRAAVLTEIGKPLEIMDFPDIPELQVGQVLVNMKVAGICGAQIREITGVKGEDHYLPHMLGHEGFGRVVGIGPGVQTVDIGDSVVVHWRKGDGIESSCPAWITETKPRGHWSTWKRVGAGPCTTWGEMSIVFENRVTKVPDDTDPMLGALMGCAMTTALGIVYREAKIQPGQSVLVIGAGGVGQCLTWAARQAGAYPIHAVDKSKEALVLAYSNGADKIFESIDLLSDQYDVVVEFTGIAPLINHALSHTCSGGKLILVGQPRSDSDVWFTGFSRHYCGKIIQDSQGGSTIPQEDIPRYLRWVKGRNLNTSMFVTRIGKLEDINEMVQDLRQGKIVGRAMIQFD